MSLFVPPTAANASCFGGVRHGVQSKQGMQLRMLRSCVSASGASRVIGQASASAFALGQRRQRKWRSTLRMSGDGSGGDAPPEFESDAQYVAKLLAGTVGIAVAASLAGIKPPLPLLIPPLLSAITLVKKPQLDLASLQSRGSMNSELLAPSGVASTCKPAPSGTARVYPVEKQILKNAFLRVIAKQPRTVLSHVSEDKNTYGFVARSLLLQFPDLVTVSFCDVEQGQSSTFAIYSQSIYGQGDLGANKKRVGEWLAALDKEL